MEGSGYALTGKLTERPSCQWISGSTKSNRVLKKCASIINIKRKPGKVK